MEPDTETLREVRQRREDLLRVLVALERHLAGPASAPGWSDGLRERAETLRASWAVHVAVTEGPGGLHEDILEAAPRLAGPVGRLRAEHRDISVAIEEEIQELAAAAPDPAPEVRERLLGLLARLARHRQRGADLIYEAFEVDIGGG